MTIKTQADDTLTLELTKQHLYVDFANDDALITNLITASLQAVEHYMNLQVLDTVYEATSNELFEDDDAVMKLWLPYQPHAIVVVDGATRIYTERDDYYYYDNAESYLYVPYTETLTEVDAQCGGVFNASIDQARLLLIGNWYAFREADVNGAINKLPTGATFLLDSLEGAIL